MAKSPPKASVPPIAVFHGPQRFLQLQHTETLKTQLRAQHGDISPTMFDGATAQPAEILDECRSLSLMQQHRLVIVDNADQLLKASDDDEESGVSKPPAGGRGGMGKSARELFESYAESPDSSATLVFRAMTWRPGRIDKAITASGGVVVKCDELSEHEAAAWAMERIKSHHGTTIDRNAAMTLVTAVGNDLGRLDTEMAKLALAAGGKAVSDGLVKEMVGVTREEEFWAIQSSLLSGDAPKALSHLRSMLEVSRHDATPLLFTYCDLARKLHGASRGLAARENPRSLMGRLRLWGPSGETLIQRAAGVNPEAAAHLVGQTVKAMVRQRTGDGDPEHILEGLTLEFAEVCGGRGR